MPTVSRDLADPAPGPALPSLRPVRDADGPAVAALIEACFAEYPGCLFSWDEFPELRAPASWAEGRGTRMWVAEDEAGAVVGCLCATPDGADLELHKFYVARQWRGAGLAMRLFAQIAALAGESRAERIVLWTDTRFVRAHRFYEKLGFARGHETRLLHDISDSEEFFYALPMQAPR
jgi:putative acetyltransferase